MTHGTQVVNFIGLHSGNNGDEVGGIAQVTVVQENLYGTVVTVTVNVVDTASVEAR